MVRFSEKMEKSQKVQKVPILFFLTKSQNISKIINKKD
jgi:hypothetical protein